MAIKFVVMAPDEGELQYCKAVLILADPTLGTSDIDLVNPNTTGYYSLQQQINYVNTTYKNYPQKPFIIKPIPLNSTHIDVAFWNYPNNPIFIPFSNLPYGHTFPYPYDYTGFPAAQQLKVPHIVATSGGVGGLSDWYTGAGLEFTDEALVEYMSGATPVTSFTVTSIVNDGGGVMRINSSNITGFTSVGNIIHIAGATGLQFSPNGAHVITETGSGYVKASFNVGTGSSGGTITGQVHYNSGSVCTVAAKINKIMRTRGITFGQARMIARATATNPTRDDTHGYGQIDVAAALAYAGASIPDAMDTMGAIATLSGVVAGTSYTLSAPITSNAINIHLYKDNREFSVIKMSWEQSWSYYFLAYELGSHGYKIRGERNGIYTAYSNTQSTNLLFLSGLPLKSKYSYLDQVYVLRDGLVIPLTVETIRTTISNPENNSAGRQDSYYKFVETGIAYEVHESRVFSSRNHLTSTIKSHYVNQATYEGLGTYTMKINSIDYFTSAFFKDYGGLDLVGFNFNNSDLARSPAVILYLSNKIVDNTSFVGATLPTGQTTRAQVRAAVGSYDEKTTIMPDGFPIGRTG